LLFEIDISDLLLNECPLEAGEMIELAELDSGLLIEHLDIFALERGQLSLFSHVDVR
jgi:hypothetical protein